MAKFKMSTMNLKPIGNEFNKLRIEILDQLMKDGKMKEGTIIRLLPYMNSIIKIKDKKMAKLKLKRYFE